MPPKSKLPCTYKRKQIHELYVAQEVTVIYDLFDNLLRNIYESQNLFQYQQMLFNSKFAPLTQKLRIIMQL